MPSGTPQCLLYQHRPMRLRSSWIRNNTNAITYRSFLTRAYPTMKHHNPHTPIMIREAMGVEPRVFARYEFGREKMLDLRGTSAFISK